MARRKSTSKSELDSLVRHEEKMPEAKAAEGNAEVSEASVGASDANAKVSDASVGASKGNAEVSDANTEVSEEKAESLQKPKRKKKEAFKKTLEKILSMQVNASVVSEAVFFSNLGKNISYQEAILLALVIKAANGDVQAATFIRDTSGNKGKDETEKQKCIKFEDL